MVSSERRLKRIAERERLRQRELQRKKRATRLFTALAVVAAVGALITFAVLALNNGTAAAGTAGTEAADNASQANALRRQLPLQAYTQHYFFEGERSQRYKECYASNPALTVEQAIVLVNLDLDSTAYEVASPVPDPDSFLVLVNKHHYLPYDYCPPDLDSVGDGDILLRYEAALYLEQLIASALEDGVFLSPGSGFRYATEQEALYNGYVSSLGAEWADAQSARPGFSEHQTGLAVDFRPANSEFYNTPEAHWLEEHAHHFGFIIRYTEENSNVTLFIHEPWHIRYVGVEVANFMHDNAIGSYEEYYVKYVQHTPPVG